MDAVTRHRQLRLAGFDLPDAAPQSPRTLSVGVVERDLAHDGDIRHLELRLLGVAVSDPELTFEARALVAALAEFTDETRSAAFNPALHPRNPKGSPGGGRFRSLVARVIGALEAWSKGDSPSNANPFEGLGFKREHLRDAAKHLGIPLRRGATEKEIVEALKADVKAKRAGAKDAKPEAGKPVRFTLTGGGKVGQPPPTPPNPTSPWGQIRDLPRTKWSATHGRPGNLDQVDQVYISSRSDAQKYLRGLGRGRLEAIADAVDLDVRGLDPDRDRERYVEKVLDGIREPGQDGALGGGDSKLRDLDVGVYQEGGKVSLWEVSDTGERRKRVALVDDLPGLEAWADEHGESELADWVRKERGGEKGPTAKATAKSPLADEARAILANSNGSTYELEALLSARTKRQLLGIAEHLGVDAPDKATAAQLRERIQQDLMPEAGTKPTGRFNVMRLNDVLTEMAESAVDLDAAHSRGARASWPDVLDATPGRSSTAGAASRESLHDYKSDDKYRELDYTTEDSTIKGVRSAMRPIESDVVVWRGERSLNKKVPRGALSRKGGMEGVEWTGGSFSSTSADEAVARDFALNDDGSAQGSQPVLMRLRVPAGTRAVAIDSVLQREGPDDITGYLKEQELLLADGLRYRITKDYGVVRGVRQVDVEVVPSEPLFEGFEGLAALGGGGAPAKAAGARVANLPPVQVHVDASSGSDVGRWRATHAEGLSGSQTALLAAVTDRVRTSGRLANGRLRTPDAPLHNQSIDELLGRVPLNAEKAAKAAAAADRHIGALDKAMEQSRLPTDAVLWRGIRPADVSLPDGDATGFEWTDPAYVGTSGTRNVAEGSFAQGALLRIAAPSGTRAIGIQGGGEHEVLLDRGQRFRVVADRRTPSGARELDVEIVGTAPDVPAKPTTDVATSDKPLSEGELVALQLLSAQGWFADGGWVNSTQVTAAHRENLDSLAAKGYIQKTVTGTETHYRINPQSVGAQKRPAGDGALEGDILPPPATAESRLPLYRIHRGAILSGYRDPGDSSAFGNVPADGSADPRRVVRVVVQRIERVDENGERTTAPLATHRRIIGHDADTGRLVSSDVVSVGSHWNWHMNPDEDTSPDIEGEAFDVTDVPHAGASLTTGKVPRTAKKAEYHGVSLVDHLRTLDTEARRDQLDLIKVGTVDEPNTLKGMLRAQGLPVSGKKRDLVDRLVESLAQPTREDRIKQLMLSGLTRDEAEAQLAGKSVRPSGLPAKPMSADFDDLAERLSTGTQAQVLEVLQDLNATELTKLARKFPGTAMFVPGVLKTSERRQGMRIPEGLSLEQMRQWLAKQLMDRRFQWRSMYPDDDEIDRADYEDDDEDLTDDDAPSPEEVGDEDEDLDDPTLDEIQAMAAEDDGERTMPLGARARELALLGVTRAAGHDVVSGRDELHHYWTRGEGLAKWANSPKPWTTLVAHLIRHVGLRKAKIFASRWFIEVFDFAAGSDLNRVTHGHPPRGKRVGPG